MSVIVKGMAMPTACGLCPFDDYGYCTRTKRYSGGSATHGRASFCPLAELPEKHGRLVDVNALKVALIHAGQASGRYRVGETWELNFEEILDVLAESPTIVEVEAEGENDNRKCKKSR